jgi:hypothetical protein
MFAPPLIPKWNWAMEACANSTQAIKTDNFVFIKMKFMVLQF